MSNMNVSLARVSRVCSQHARISIQDIYKKTKKINKNNGSFTKNIVKLKKKKRKTQGKTQRNIIHDENINVSKESPSVVSSPSSSSSCISPDRIEEEQHMMTVLTNSKKFNDKYTLLHIPEKTIPPFKRVGESVYTPLNAYHQL